MRGVSTEKPATSKLKTNGITVKKQAKTNGHAKSDYLDQEHLLSVLMIIKKGDFTSRLPDNRTGVTGKSMMPSTK